MLDVGCGAGLLLLAGASSGRVASGCGVDISERALQAARHALATIGKSSAAVTFQSAAVGQLPPGPFDVVTLIDVMHHVPPVEQQGLFAASAERLRPGGVLLYKGHVREAVVESMGEPPARPRPRRQWIHYVPLADVAAWAAVLGFSVTRREEYSRFWYGHELLVLRRG